MIVLEESAEVYTLRDADIQLSFRHVGDRWQHFVSVRRSGEWSPLLTSEEGVPADGVLPSPALQDLRLEELRDGVFEFQLLGQSGKGVYSAAVRFEGGAQSIDFDLCARGRSAESPFCTVSRYLLGDGDGRPTVQPRENSLVVQARGEPALELSPVSIPGQPASECRLIDDGPLLRIAAGCFGATRFDPNRKGISVRWRYRIALAGDP